MRRPVFCVLGLVLLCSLALAQRRVAPEAGMVITESVRVRPGRYLVPAPAGEDPWRAAITVRGDNLTVDLDDVTLMGTPETTLPDARRGTAILVEGRNVTLKGGSIRGYKVGILARGAAGIKVLDVDVSYNWKQRLKSTIEREHLDDWMSYHQNEKDEWLRYGAGIYLRDCDGFEVRGCKATGGQCGLMVIDSDRGHAWNNDFSFLSGIGLGLYRSSENRVMHNRLDWCVRGYSHRVYNRGQDSAGILVYEQSNRNVFAYNSATHGGDGFFLWAGQSTMDTGEGGCNDNLVFGNDFSHAPANGIEATFSRNSFVNNLMMECWHGVWGGYSYNSLFLHNFFGDNEEGVAIEHGQENAVRGNFFQLDQKSVRLWQNPTQDPNWAYPKKRDTRSRDNLIDGNYFGRPLVGVDLRDTTGTRVIRNRFQVAGQALSLQGNTAGLVFENNVLSAVPAEKVGAPVGTTNKLEESVPIGLAPGWDPFAKDDDLPAEVLRLRPRPLEKGMDPFLKPGAPRGRYHIVVDEWGPYDFRSPKLWPEPPRRQTVEEAGRVPQAARAEVQRFRVMGPKGRWRVVSQSGAERVSPSEGDVPGTLEVTLAPGKAVDLSLELEYEGEATVDVLGNRTPKGREVRFGYRRFYAPIAWNVKVFGWDQRTDPRTRQEAFMRLIMGPALHEARMERLDFGTSRSFFREVAKVPSDRFATVAEGTVELPAGEYVVELTTDDGARLWIDGKKAIDEWKYQGPTTYTAPISGGKHRLRVEHFEIDGYAALQVAVRKR